MSCKFCLYYDFSRVGVDAETMSIRTAGGNTTFREEEQFKYCPVCGSVLDDTYKPKRYTLFYIKELCGPGIQGMGMCPTDKLNLKDDTEVAIATFDTQEDLVYLLVNKFPGGKFSYNEALARNWSEKLMNAPLSELDYIKRYVYFYWNR